MTFTNTQTKLGQAITTNVSGDYAVRTIIEGNQTLGDLTLTGDISLTDGGVIQADANTNQLYLATDGGVGINTATVPHGGIGIAKIAIDGLNAAAGAPIIQFTTASDNHPIFQQFMWAHDNLGLLFDSYFDGASFISSDAGSNFRIYKNTDALSFDCNSGTAQGAGISWTPALTIAPDASSTFGGYIGLHQTDTDSAVEGQMWYDASENKIKFYNGTAVETVTSA